MNKPLGVALPPSRLTPIDEALPHLLQTASTLVGEHTLPLLQASGHILAHDTYAPLDVPGYDNSAMDGFALNSSELLFGRTEFRIAQRIPAGTPGTDLQPTTAARIFTGAPLPPGADTVVMQENCRFDGDTVTVQQAVSAGENVRCRGDDIAAGSLLLAAGHRLAAADIGLLAASGLAEVTVRKALTVALLTTGNELVRPGVPLQPGQIYNSNFYAISALLQSIGVTVIDCGIVGDEQSATEQALLHAAAQADCVISSGGVSAGEEDHVRNALQAQGELALWKLAIKPGKPFAWGRVQGKTFFGLPGNPVSAFVTFMLLVRPFLLRCMGASQLHPHTYRVPAGFELPESAERQEYLRVRLVTDSAAGNNSGVAMAVPFGNQSSGVLSSLSHADGLLVIPPFTAVVKGDMLNFMPLL